MLGFMSRPILFRQKGGSEMTRHRMLPVLLVVVMVLAGALTAAPVLAGEQKGK